MSFCHNCGTEINEGDKFCQNCGTLVAEVKSEEPLKVEYSSEQSFEDFSSNIDPEPDGPNKKDKLGKLGFTFGLIGFICSFIPFVDIYTMVLAILGLVFGLIGKKGANLPENRAKASKGFVFGLIGTILSFFIFIIFYVVLLSLAISEGI